MECKVFLDVLKLFGLYLWNKLNYGEVKWNITYFRCMSKIRNWQSNNITYTYTVTDLMIWPPCILSREKYFTQNCKGTTIRSYFFFIVYSLYYRIACRWPLSYVCKYQKFYDVFRGYGKRSVAWDELGFFRHCRFFKYFPWYCFEKRGMFLANIKLIIIISEITVEFQAFINCMHKHKFARNMLASLGICRQTNKLRDFSRYCFVFFVIREDIQTSISYWANNHECTKRLSLKFVSNFKRTNYA